MTRVMFGTLLTIGNYRGSCTKCGGPIEAKEVRGIYLGENVVNHSIRVRIINDIYCPVCDLLVNNAEIYGLEWQPYMFARCN